MIPLIVPIVASVAGAVVSVAAKAIYDKVTEKPPKCPKCHQRDSGYELTCCKTALCEECAKGMGSRGTCEFCGSAVKWR